jgi:hypothetical protein
MARYYMSDGSTTYELDEQIGRIETDLPARTYKKTKRGGQGSHVTGMGMFTGRTISLTKTFLKWDEQDRDDFLEWFTRTTGDLWLYKSIEWTVPGTVTSGSPNVTVVDSSTFRVGDSVTGTNIPADTTISSITDSTTFVINNNATGTGTVGLTIVNFLGRMAVKTTPGGGRKVLDPTVCFFRGGRV